MRVQRLITLLLVVVLALISVGTQHVTAADAKTLVIGLAENSTSLDPARGYEQETSIIHKAVYETLVTFPPDNVEKILPNLATSWDISPDGLTYTFKLKDGVVFSSGNPMTADDAVFSFKRVMNVKSNPSSLAGNFDSVSAPDPKTFVLKLKAPDPSTLAIIVFSAFAVTDSKTVKANGGTDAADADKSDKAEEWLSQNSAGTGPYMLTKWEKHNAVTLVRNPKYNGKAAAFDTVLLRDIPQAAAQKAALEAGDIDIALDLTADQIASIKNNPELKLYEGPSPIVFFLLMNQDKTIGGPMSDPKVQQAVRMALDYEGIVKLLGGAAITPPSIIPVGFAGALPKDKTLKRDVNGAKALLKDAGQDKGFSIEMEYWDTTYQGVNFGTLAQKIQADLKDIGIDVKLKPGTIDVTLPNYRDGKEGFGMWFWGPDFQDPQNYLEFLPTMKVGLRVNWNDANGDAKIKDLLAKAKVEVDPAKRTDLFAQIQQSLQQSGPFAPFVQPGVQIGYRADVKGMAYNFQWGIDPAAFSK
jgi:peptide/nickel transport system substrate-binding protein